MVNSSNAPHGNLITQANPQTVPRNVFAQLAQDQTQTPSRSSDIAKEQVQATEQQESHEEMQVQVEQNLGESSVDVRVTGDQQGTAPSQSLALPLQSFVRDTFESTADAPTAMDVDPEETDEMPLSPIASDGGDLSNRNAVGMTPVAQIAAPIESPQENAATLDRTLAESMTQSTLEAAGMSDVQTGLRKSRHEGTSLNRSEETVAAPSPQVPLAHPQPVRRPVSELITDNAVAAPSRQVPLAHPQPHPMSRSLKVPEPRDVAPPSQVRAKTPILAQNSAATRPVRSRTAEPQVSATAQNSCTPKRVLHRATSTSRSGRMLPPRTVPEAQKQANEDDGAPPMAKHAIVQNEPGDDRAAANGTDSRGAQSAQEQASRVESEVATRTSVPKSKQKPEDAKKKTFKTIRTENHPAKANGVSDTSSKSRKINGGDPTGNARFQQMLQQSTGRGPMTADQLITARAAALPPKDLGGMTSVINPSFATASNQQKNALLDSILSRSSSPSNARAMKGHPRAITVQERRAQQAAAKTPQRELQGHQGPIPENGSEDEKMAIDLVFRAKEREVEISKLRQQIQTLEQQNASLEKFNANLVVDKGNALRENANIIQQKKDAISKARVLIVASQNM